MIFIYLLMAYMVGSIPFSQWLNSDKELTHYGSTNVYRNSGFLKGLAVQILDIAKGLTVLFVPEQYQFMYLITAMFGQILPCLWHKKGGKGVNTFFGGSLILDPYLTIVGLLIFGWTLAMSRYVSLASLASVLFISMVLVVTFNNPMFILLFYMITTTHISNIVNLLNGQENQI